MSALESNLSQEEQKGRKGEKKKVKMRACRLERAQVQHCCGNASQSISIKMQTSRLMKGRNSGNAEIILQFGTFTLQWK